MSPPLREHAAQAAVLADPAAHWPHRPTWACDADGQDWPCEAFRGHLLATMPPQDIGVAMGGYYPYAARELDTPPADVHHRLFGWIRGR